MSNDSASIVPAARPQTLGDRLRGIAEELRQETDIQIKATSRILGAAAQMAQNHDQLIDEVVEMVEEDLERQGQQASPEPYTAAQLKQQFKTLKAAKLHFGLKAGSWKGLAEKLNQAPGAASGGSPAVNAVQDGVLQRLDAIEQEIKGLQGNMGQVLGLLQEIAGRI